MKISEILQKWLALKERKVLVLIYLTTFYIQQTKGFFHTFYKLHNGNVN